MGGAESAKLLIAVALAAYLLPLTPIRDNLSLKVFLAAYLTGVTALIYSTWDQIPIPALMMVFGFGVLLAVARLAIAFLLPNKPSRPDKD